MAARIVQVSVSRGGIPKRAVAAARVKVDGVEGDTHRNLELHGGPERAVCLFAMEAIVALQAEGHTIAPGAIGENVTVEGLDWSNVTPGTHLLVGQTVLLQVTRYTSPCRTIGPVFSDGQFIRVSQKHRPGWSRVYARVLVEGVIRPNDPVRLVDEIEAAEIKVAALP
ncbi:MAG TPA: MOSC domain-containing protein [Methylomirabilota bacterium]|nr:MOSC domain-containing protein [Methylomirabilota bacterium]